jgi:hypothetical protein
MNKTKEKNKKRIIKVIKKGILEVISAKNKNIKLQTLKEFLAKQK